MVLTPTYHVFDMYKEHMDAMLVYSNIENKNIYEGKYLPAVSQSVSEDESGKLHITVSNSSLDEDFDVDCVIPRAEYTTVKARILTSGYKDFNDFDHPEDVCPSDYSEVKLCGEKLCFTLPRCSVLSIELG